MMEQQAQEEKEEEEGPQQRRKQERCPYRVYELWAADRAPLVRVLSLLK
jgi:hypothetical protein